MTGTEIVDISLPTEMENAETRQKESREKKIQHGGYFPSSQTEIWVTNDIANGLENNLELKSGPSFQSLGKLSIL